MTASLQQATTGRIQPPTGDPGRALRLVPPRAVRAPRAPFVALIVGLLAAGLIGLLVLNTLIAENSFRLHALAQHDATLALRQQEMQRDVELLEAPNALASEARRLGMVPAGNPAFIRLSDGKVLGVPVPATVPRPVTFAVRPSPRPGGNPSASPAAHPAGSPNPARTPTPRVSPR
ncbi:MAG: hypothetical protein M3042_09940 [Actinomycetota bacterium]|nr:hypothetical protein [Actinomycetota bacterium]